MCLGGRWVEQEADSHLCVSHRGLGGRVSISGGGGVGPVFWWRLSINSGLVNRFLGQGGHRHQGVGLVLLIHLERLSLKESTELS